MNTATPNELRTAMIIRFALFMGVVLFGAVTWFLHSQGNPPAGPELAAMLARVLPFAGLAALGAAIVIRRLALAATTFPDRLTKSMIGWALGEATGLLGGVIYFMGDDARYWLVGVIVMLIVMIIIPLRDPA